MVSAGIGKLARTIGSGSLLKASALKFSCSDLYSMV